MFDLPLLRAVGHPHPLNADPRLVAVALARRWPLEHFVVLVARLAAADPERRVVVTSGPSEGDAAARVIAGARSRLDAEAVGRVLSCGDFSLPELRALLDLTRGLAATLEPEAIAQLLALTLAGIRQFIVEAPAA